MKTFQTFYMSVLLFTQIDLVATLYWWSDNVTPAAQSGDSVICTLSHRCVCVCSLVTGSVRAGSPPERKWKLLSLEYSLWRSLLSSPDSLQSSDAYTGPTGGPPSTAHHATGPPDAESQHIWTWVNHHNMWDILIWTLLKE